MKTYLSGARGVEEALKRGRGILLLARKDGRSAVLENLASKRGVPVRRVTRAKLDALCPSAGHRGFLLEVDEGDAGHYPALRDLKPRLGTQSLLLVLDGVTDTRNFGALLRSADQFAVDAVLIPRRRSSAVDSDAVSRTSSGAVEWVPLVRVPNISRSLGELKDGGLRVWGADAVGQSAASADLTGPVALVMGREGEGLHRLVREHCDGLISIPTGGRLDSLNVATAAGILLYEIRRQQGFPHQRELKETEIPKGEL